MKPLLLVFLLLAPPVFSQPIEVTEQAEPSKFEKLAVYDAARLRELYWQSQVTAAEHSDARQQSDARISAVERRLSRLEARFGIAFTRRNQRVLPIARPPAVVSLRPGEIYQAAPPPIRVFPVPLLR